MSTILATPKRTPRSQPKLGFSNGFLEFSGPLPRVQRWGPNKLAYKWMVLNIEPDCAPAGLPTQVGNLGRNEHVGGCPGDDGTRLQ